MSAGSGPSGDAASIAAGIAAQWRRQAEQLEAYAGRMRPRRGPRSQLEAECAEAEAVAYRQAADDLEAWGSVGAYRARPPRLVEPWV